MGIRARTVHIYIYMQREREKKKEIRNTHSLRRRAAYPTRPFLLCKKSTAITSQRNATPVSLIADCALNSSSFIALYHLSFLLTEYVVGSALGVNKVVSAAHDKALARCPVFSWRGSRQCKGGGGGVALIERANGVAMGVLYIGREVRADCIPFNHSPPLPYLRQSRFLLFPKTSDSRPEPPLGSSCC